MSIKQLVTGCALLATLSMAATQAHATQSFRLAWSLYPGYMPWDYASESGIVERWADKYGIAIEIVQINDYVEAINQYTAGEFDADMVSLFAHPSTEAMVTWNPMASDVLQQPDAVNIYDSSQMPGELTDSIVVNTATLEKHPELGKALLGAWFETMAIMQGDDDAAIQAREAMGIAAGTDLAGYEQQLEATYLFYSPEEVASVMADQQLQETMANIANFSFERGLLGSGQDLSETIGISYPDGTV